MENLDELFWDVVSKINWNQLSRSTKRSELTGVVCELYRSMVPSLEKRQYISKEILVKVKILESTLKGYSLGKQGDYEFFTVSDDGLFDLCSHIVGLGENVYELVRRYPYLANEYISSKVENFVYGFINEEATEYIIPKECKLGTLIEDNPEQCCEEMPDSARKAVLSKRK